MNINISVIKNYHKHVFINSTHSIKTEVLLLSYYKQECAVQASNVIFPVY